MSGQYQIETGVPLPAVKGKAGTGRFGALAALEVGQSIFEPNYDVSHRSAYASTRNVMRKYPGRKFSSRKVDGGLRVWRIA